MRRTKPPFTGTSLFDLSTNQRFVSVTMADLHDDSGDYVQLVAVEAGDELRLMAVTNREGDNQADFERQPDDSFLERSTGEVYPADSPTSRAFRVLGEGILMEYPNILAGPRTLSVGDPFLAEGYEQSVETVIGEMVSALGGTSARLTVEFAELILTGTTAVEGQPALVFQGSARATAELATTDVVLTLKVSKVQDIATGIVVRESIERRYISDDRRSTTTDRRECEAWEPGEPSGDQE